jgi:hypothetical protein
MNVNEVYEIVQYVANKEQNGYLSPAEFNLNAKLAEGQYLASLISDLRTYQPGRPISRVELGQNSVVRQRLSPCIKQATLTINGTTGFSPYPDGYIQTDAVWTNTGYQRIRYVDQDKWFLVANSVIDPIATNPIYRLEDTGFSFLPVSLGSAKLSYVKTPVFMNWGFTLDSNGLPVYNPATSAQPVWDDVAIFDVIVRILQRVGINLQQGQVVQYAQMIKNEGQ